MRKSCHQQNRKMHQAYQLFQSGQLTQSLQIYQSLLERTTNPQLRYNLLCTISVISITIGNYNYALEVLQYNLCNLINGVIGENVSVRYMANMCFLQIVMGMFEEAVDMFKRIKEIVRDQDVENRGEIIGFLIKIFFRVGSINQILEQIDVKNKNSLLQAFYMLNIALARDFLSYPNSQKLLKAAYPIFISHNKFHLAVVCIRQLLLLPLCNKQITKYEKQLSKIISMDLMENYQIDNKLSMECCKYIAHELVNLIGEIQVSKKDRQGEQDNTLWIIVLKYQGKKLNIGGLQQEQRSTIKKNIDMMLQQQNSVIIKQMKKTDFYLSSQRQIKQILHSFTQSCESFVNIQLRNSWKKLQSFSQKINPKMLRNKSQSQINNKNNRSQKQNRLPITPIGLNKSLSSKSLINQAKKPLNQNQNDKSLSIIGLQQKQKEHNQKTLYKMIKFCEYGSFLNKRNFNSDGGQYRFVRVTQSILKWAKNPQKIQESHQFYPLKDIKSIVYGKCTPTLLKQTNQLLKQQFCFSLNLRKRTLDFYCKDFEQTSNWICGLSHKLKQIHPNFRAYTKGRLLWKKMFMILRQNFTNNIKSHERKFYYETAQAVILFGKNGYKLNTK